MHADLRGRDEGVQRYLHTNIGQATWRAVIAIGLRDSPSDGAFSNEGCGSNVPATRPRYGRSVLNGIPEAGGEILRKCLAGAQDRGRRLSAATAVLTAEIKHRRECR